MQNLAEEHGGKCLSIIYKGMNTKLTWQCAEGHVWEAIPSSIQQGTWCKICSNKKSAAQKRLNVEIVKNFIYNHGGTWLSGQYNNNQSKLTISCKNGHIWVTTWLNIQSSFKRGGFCPRCGHKRANLERRKKIEEMKSIAESRGGKCISNEYVSMHEKLTWQCAEGHIWQAIPLSIIHAGSWCPKCKVTVGEQLSKQIFTVIFNKPFNKKYLKWLINPSTGRRMHLDGYNEELKLAFEYNGIQHYVYNPYFHRNRKQFNIQQMKDLVKKKLCRKNGIELIIIPYTIPYEDLPDFIIKECKRKKIPLGDKPLELYDITSLRIYNKNRLHELQKIVSSKGGVCLSRFYVRGDVKMTFRCREGHTWKAIPKQIMRGSWCPVCRGNAPLTLEKMNEIARANNGECVSTTYVNTTTKLKWRCSKDHEWETTPQVVLNGAWCPYCAGNALLNIIEMKELAASHGGACLSETYVNSKTKLKWRCSAGHEWNATPAHIKSGTWCPKCRDKDVANKLRKNINDMHTLAQSRGGVCLSTKYVNNRIKLRWQCSKDHTWTATPHNIQRGKWCPTCAGTIKGTIEGMRKIAESHGGECLSEIYVNNNFKLKWQCSEGHIWEAIPKTIKKGHWCPICARKRKKK